MRLRHRELASEKVRRVIEQCARWGAVVGLRGLVQSQVLQDFLDDVGVLNTGDHPDPPATLLAFLYVDGEHAFEPLCPGH